MTLDLQQLKQIIQYNAKRMYFGEWRPIRIDEIFRNTSGGNRPEELPIGNLTEDIICNVLWYEMSYNPVRFGTVSPFKNPDGKNSILYFIDTYRKKAPREENGLIPNDIMTLVWQIGDFVKNLKKADLYDGFVKTGKLPQVLSILGADENYYVLTTLRKAIHAIAKQNWQDLKDPMYKKDIIEIAMKRHPAGKRSDISYMMIKLENSVQQKKSKPEEIKSTEIKTIKPQNQKQPNVVQMCLPFFKKEKIDNLAVIREKIVQKQNEIAMLEQQIKDMQQDIEYADLKELHKRLKTAKLQYAALYGQEAKLLKKIKLKNSNENSGR